MVNFLINISGLTVGIMFQIVFIWVKGGCVACHEDGGPEGTNIGNHIYQYRGLGGHVHSSLIIYILGYFKPLCLGPSLVFPRFVRLICDGDFPSGKAENHIPMCTFRMARAIKYSLMVLNHILITLYHISTSYICVCIYIYLNMCVYSLIDFEHGIIFSLSLNYFQFLSQLLSPDAASFYDVSS